jgi:carnitine monooxygenase subunit
MDDNLAQRPYVRTKSGFSPIAEHSGTLPSHYYFDPAIFRREAQEVWFKTWQYVGNLCDLRNHGDYITDRIVDQEVLVVRDREGRLRAYYNVCKHRGHLLIEGKGNARKLVCPFHAWSYDTDGRLTKAPNAENVPAFDYSEFSLSEIRVETLGPLVFVNLDDQAPSLDSVAGGLLAEWRRAIPHFDELKFVRHEVFPVRANWKFILDGLECYHCPYIHPQVMGNKDSYLTTTFDSHHEEFWSTHVTLGDYEMMEKNKEKMPYPFEQADIKDIFIWFLWPNLVFVARQGPSNFQVLRAVPDGVEGARRHMVNFCLNDPPTAFDLGHMDFYRDVVWPQDREAMEKQGRGIRSRGYRQGRLMVDREHSWRSEHGTHHFQNLVWRALNGPNY